MVILFRVSSDQSVLPGHGDLLKRFMPSKISDVSSAVFSIFFLKSSYLTSSIPHFFPAGSPRKIGFTSGGVKSGITKLSSG